jgi:hypothetical protein
LLLVLEVEGAGAAALALVVDVLADDHALGERPLLEGLLLLVLLVNHATQVEVQQLLVRIQQLIPGTCIDKLQFIEPHYFVILLKHLLLLLLLLLNSAHRVLLRGSPLVHNLLVLSLALTRHLAVPTAIDSVLAMR